MENVLYWDLGNVDQQVGGRGERATDNESVGWRGDLNAWEMYSPTGPAPVSFLFLKRRADATKR